MTLATNSYVVLNTTHDNDVLQVVIVGTGPAGMRAALELIKLRQDIHISIYGNEPWLPYNRVLLSSYLAGEIKNSELFTDLKEFKSGNNLIENHNCAIVDINRQKKFITDRYGNTKYYDKLILATGSSPHTPHINGLELDGVYTFRDLNDANKLYARQTRSRMTVVVGGGFLGIETAKAMQRNSTGVVVVEHSPRLMSQQLDTHASTQLKGYLEDIGIKIFLSDSVKSISGSTRVENVTLNSGEIIKCDTVVLATGIRSNISLALNAGLPVGRGIKVNEFLQTADQDIYAIGECAEHNERVYGLAAPGIEQATIVAHNLSGRQAVYTGSQLVNHIKVIDTKVFSVGIAPDDVEPGTHKEITFKSVDGSLYRKIILKNRTIVGCIALGEYEEAGRVQEAIQNKRSIWIWQQYRFKKYGSLWAQAQSDNVNQWPAKSIVCNCKAITRGQISKVISGGKSFDCQFANVQSRLNQVLEITGASSVCGTCRPLVMQLCGEQNAKTQNKPTLMLSLFVSALALIAMLMLFALAPIPYSESVQIRTLDLLWQNNLIKQITGFTLLGLSLVGLVISLRKRFTAITFGSFNLWRSIHIVIGAVALLVLVAHTGFNLGVNLNGFLMLTFLGVLLAGVLSGLVVSLESTLSARNAKRLRYASIWAHILSAWPLPFLLGFHVLSSYYY